MTAVISQGAADHDMARPRIFTCLVSAESYEPRPRLTCTIVTVKFITNNYVPDEKPRSGKHAYEPSNDTFNGREEISLIMLIDWRHLRIFKARIPSGKQ